MTAKEKARDSRYKREYHITLDEYNKVLETQCKVCAICKESVKPGKANLAVDHKHKDGLLRGLLCWPCNRLLGHINENKNMVSIAAALLAYIQNPPFTKTFGTDRFTAPGEVGTKKRAKLLRLMKKGSDGNKRQRKK